MDRINDELNMPMGAGGLMNFQSFADGAERLDERVRQMEGNPLTT